MRRLVIIDQDGNEEQNNIIEELFSRRDEEIRIYIETDIVPYNDMDNILELTEDDKGEKLFEDLTRIIEECKEEELNNEISEFIEKYI